MLKVNKDELRKRYKAKNHSLPESLIEKLVLRNALLGENTIFVKEWWHLNELEKSNNRKKYLEACKRFRQKWYIIHPSGEHDIENLPSAYVRIIESNIYDGKVTIEIDLNGSKGKIISELISLVSSWHKEFLKRLEDHWNMRFEKDNFNKKGKESRQAGNLKADFADYYLYLDILAARNDGVSWSDIVNRLKLQNIDTARNHCRSAKRLVQNGLPGLPPFPKE